MEDYYTSQEAESIFYGYYEQEDWDSLWIEAANSKKILALVKEFASDNVDISSLS